MAFEFFKKSINADLVLTGGMVLTQDVDNPTAEAVACEGGKIIAVGSAESMEGLIGKDTEVVDLEGKFLVPGKISLFDNPVNKAFENKYADLTEVATTDDLIEVLEAWAESHPDADVLFGYGYDESIFGEDLEEDLEKAPELLDQSCEDRPVVILAKNNLTCLLNSCAMGIVAETAEEEMVEVVTAPYILNLLIPFDFEELEADIASQIGDNLKHGITSMLNLDSPDYFESFYRDALVGLSNEEALNQRFFGSYYVNRPVLTKGLIYHLMNRRNTCIEMDDLVKAEILYIDLDTQNCPVEFDEEMLFTIVEETADRGFDIFIKAASSHDADMAYAAGEHIRTKGYKTLFAIDAKEDPSAETLADMMYADTLCILNGQPDNPIESDPYELVGMSDKLGSIEVGKLADMAVFTENPYESKEPLEAVMTVFDGQIV